MTRQERRQIVKEHIEQILTHCFPNDKFLHDQVRHANGFVGQDFVGMAMPDKERQKLLNAYFGKGGW